jgi:hypothetical protein
VVSPQLTRSHRRRHIETAIVESYRDALLIACPDACLLREEMCLYFVDIVTPYHRPNPSTGSTERVVKWAFPDGIDTREIGTCCGRSYDLRKEMTDVALARATVATFKGNAVVRDTFDCLAKKRTRFCGVPIPTPPPAPGSGSLAYYCISASHPFIARVCLPRPLTASHLDVHISCGTGRYSQSHWPRREGFDRASAPTSSFPCHYEVPKRLT